MQLRFGHECTHFFTKQTYGISNNILHDEVMADFIGMYEALGFYKAEWFLQFMGLLGNDGGRIIFYAKDLSENVRKAVTALAAKEGIELPDEVVDQIAGGCGMTCIDTSACPGFG